MRWVDSTKVQGMLGVLGQQPVVEQMASDGVPGPAYGSSNSVTSVRAASPITMPRAVRMPRESRLIRRLVGKSKSPSKVWASSGLQLG